MVLAKCCEITPSMAAQVSAVKFPIAEARGFGLLTALLGSPIEATQGLAMSLERILERSTLTPKTWGGTDPFLSEIECINAVRSGVERWMKRFNALGLRGRLFPLTANPGSNRTSLAR
jgi:hypothetical protein